MGLSSSIQFRDKNAVIDAFKSRGIEAWSIVCGKQFMFKGIGEENFEQIINLLAESDSSATYTCQVYEDVSDEKRIKNNTPCDGSFNFKFNEALHQSYAAIRGIGGTPAELISKLNAIDAKLDAMESENEEQDNSLGIIGKILEHPALAPVAPKIIESLIGAIMGNQGEAVKTSLPAINGNISNGELIDKLKQHDPNLQHHLGKLLALAETDNDTFQQILKAFD